MPEYPNAVKSAKTQQNQGWRDIIDKNMARRRPPRYATFDMLLAELGAEREGSQWKARCPCHTDRRNPSLGISVNNQTGAVLLHCFAGCANSDIIADLSERGVWPIIAGDVQYTGTAPGKLPKTADERTQIAWDRWQETRPSPMVERYLRDTRCIELLDGVPDCLRYNLTAYHGWTQQYWPAMVAGVQDADGYFIAAHFTYLSRHIPPRKASVSPVRRLLGPFRGGAVRLSNPSRVMVIGEGIETTLAGMLAFELPGWSAINDKNMYFIQLPECTREVIILADNDEPGITAANNAAMRWQSQGLHARIAYPPEGYNDFNDALMGQMQ